MAITVGQNADGNAFITGNNNQTFVFYGLKEIPPELVADIQSGSKDSRRCSGSRATPSADFIDGFQRRYADAMAARRSPRDGRPGRTRYPGAVAG